RGQLVQERLIPRTLLHQLDRLLGTNAAGRALAARLVLEKAHQVQSHGFHVVLVGQDDNRVGTDEAAVFFERAEIERQVRHGRRQAATRGAARQIALEGVAVFHAATILVDQFLHGDSSGGELHAWVLHAARYGEATEALAI